MFRDNYYNLCISIARSKASKGQSYGSLLIKNKTIVGMGRNTLVCKTSYRDAVKRIISQGYANHAEVEAMNQAMDKGINPRGLSLYVGGCFKDGQLLIYDKQPEFTCTKCSRIFEKYDLKSIFVPSIHGWKEMMLDELLLSAENFKVQSKNGVEEKRRLVAVKGYTVNDCKKQYAISYGDDLYPRLI